jgi:serine/threonine-protein kinase
MKRFFFSIFLVFLSFLGGLALVNYLIMPIWIDRKDVVEVPSIVGMEVGQAREVLESKGLKFGLLGKTFSDVIPAGFIISQSPEEGLTVKRQRRIEALVSLGQESIMVPDVVGLKASQARILLERAGLVAAGEEDEVSEIVRKGCVIRTDPPAKARVPRGAEISLFVSLGRATMDMPILEGRTLAEALRIIEAMELRIAQVDSVSSADVRPGIVLSQKPQSGSRVVKGQEVDLTVSVRP